MSVSERRRVESVGVDARDAWFYDELRALGRKRTGMEVAAHVLERAGDAKRRGSAPEPVRRSRYPLWGFAVAAAGTAAAAFAVWPNSSRVADRVAASGGDRSFHAVVIGSAPLVALGAGPIRSYLTGDAIPTGVALRPQGGPGSAIGIAGRAEVRLDAGAEVWVEPPRREQDGLVLSRGRIVVMVRPASKPMRVRIPDADAEILADDASFGALWAEGGRWSAAIQAGEVRAKGAAGPLPVNAGMLVGGARGRSITARTLPTRLDVDVQLDQTKSGWMVRGLTDLLASVEVEQREIAVDETGAFRAETTSIAPIRIVAVDAVGRRVERNVQPPQNARKSPKPPAGLSPRTALQATPRASEGRAPAVSPKPADASGAALQQIEETVPIESAAPPPPTGPVRIKSFRW